MPDHHMAYIESDIPTGLTIAEWRRARQADRPVRTRRRSWRLAFA